MDAEEGQFGIWIFVLPMADYAACTWGMGGDNVEGQCKPLVLYPARTARPAAVDI